MRLGKYRASAHRVWCRYRERVQLGPHGLGKGIAGRSPRVHEYARGCGRATAARVGAIISTHHSKCPHADRQRRHEQHTLCRTVSRPDGVCAARRSGALAWHLRLGVRGVADAAPRWPRRTGPVHRLRRRSARRRGGPRQDCSHTVCGRGTPCHLPAADRHRLHAALSSRGLLGCERSHVLQARVDATSLGRHPNHRRPSRRAKRPGGGEVLDVLSRRRDAAPL